ncbi:shikimate kinase [Rhodobacterales bacterium FZCC0188]|jgi:shikimate kinase|nr:shikimate kinase [Rhodobacterales bacterium FZCC0188]
MHRVNGQTRAETAYNLHKTVVLVGMPGSGKTAVGRALSARLGVELRDSDTEIVESAQMSIAEIFERFGEPFFRDRESKVIARLLTGAPAVLSTGGGAWLSPENRDLISAQAAVLWLDADIELLWSRVRHKTTRPLLHGPNPRGKLEALMVARRPAYEQAELRLEIAHDWSIEDTTDHVLRLLHAHNVLSEVAK